MLFADIGGGPSTCMLLLSKTRTKHGQTSGLFFVASPMSPVSPKTRWVQNVPEEFFGQLLCNQRFNSGIEGNLLHFGARREPSPSGQLVQFIKFGVNRLAQRFPAFLRAIREEGVQQGGCDAYGF